MDIPIDRFNLTVGLFVLIGALLVILLGIYIVGPDLFDIGSVTAKTYLDKTYGLRRGVPVTYLDMEVGHVKSVKLSGLQNPNKRVEILFTVREKFIQYITTDFRTSLESQQFGGFLSGEIILEPPEQSSADAGPIRNGKELEFKKSKNLYKDVTDLSAFVQDELLPKVSSLLEELTLLLQRTNAPEGDFAVTLANLRKISEELSDPEGYLMSLFKTGNELAQELRDESNLLMGFLKDKELLHKMNETADNLLVASRSAAAVGEEAEDTVARVETLTGKVDGFLDNNLPRMEKALDNLLAAQEQIFPLLKDARVITASVAQAAARLPGLVNDVQLQLKEMEDIARAVKKIFIVRWYLDDETIEDPTVLKPLLLHDDEKEE